MFCKIGLYNLVVTGFSERGTMNKNSLWAILQTWKGVRRNIFVFGQFLSWTGHEVEIFIDSCNFPIKLKFCRFITPIIWEFQFCSKPGINNLTGTDNVYNLAAAFETTR